MPREASEGCRAEARRAKAGYNREHIPNDVRLYSPKSKDLERYYVGITADLRSRLSKHNAGEVPHTSKYVPWSVKTYVAFSDEKRAFEFERYLKSASGRAFARKRRQVRGEDWGWGFHR